MRWLSSPRVSGSWDLGGGDVVGMIKRTPPIRCCSAGAPEHQLISHVQHGGLLFTGCSPQKDCRCGLDNRRNQARKPVLREFQNLMILRKCGKLDHL